MGQQSKVAGEDVVPGIYRTRTRRRALVTVGVLTLALLWADVVLVWKLAPSATARNVTLALLALFLVVYISLFVVHQVATTGSARGKARSLDERQLAEERRAYSTAHKASTAIMIIVLWVMGNTITDPTDKVIAPTAVFSVFAVALTATHFVLPLLISMWRLPDPPADEAA
jgi:ABC-type transport system involved in multi-copper enzyme maturation permease subunit